ADANEIVGLLQRLDNRLPQPAAVVDPRSVEEHIEFAPVELPQRSFDRLGDPVVFGGIADEDRQRLAGDGNGGRLGIDTSKIRFRNIGSVWHNTHSEQGIVKIALTKNNLNKRSRRLRSRDHREDSQRKPPMQSFVEIGKGFAPLSCEPEPNFTDLRSL